MSTALYPYPGLGPATDALSDAEEGSQPPAIWGRYLGLAEAVTGGIPQPQPLARGGTSYSLTAEIESDLGYLRQCDVLIVRPDQIRRYLFAHSDMMDLLLAVSNRAADCLGVRAQLSLELYTDPESDEQYLTLYVRQREYEDGIMDDIEGISEAYEALLAGVSGYLLVTTDFQPPI